MDINQYDSNQNLPNNGSSYFNGNQEVNKNTQGNNNVSPMQYASMLLESYISPQNPEMEEQVNEEFTFPFSQESNPQLEEMISFWNDNRNTYNLWNQKEPITNGIPLMLQPMSLDRRTNRNLVHIRAPYVGQKNQN